MCWPTNVFSLYNSTWSYRIEIAFITLIFVLRHLFLCFQECIVVFSSSESWLTGHLLMHGSIPQTCLFDNIVTGLCSPDLIGIDLIWRSTTFKSLSVSVHFWLSTSQMWHTCQPDHCSVSGLRVILLEKCLVCCKMFETFLKQSYNQHPNTFSLANHLLKW